MNLLKKFVRNDNADLEDDGAYDDIYVTPEYLQTDMSADVESEVAAMDSPARKDPEIHPATPDKVELKLLQPKSHTEGTKIADKLKSGCIVLLDISNLTKEKAHRLVDFLAGVAYSISGKLKRVATNTYVITPSNVGVSGETMKDNAPMATPAPAVQRTTEEDGFGF